MTVATKDLLEKAGGFSYTKRDTPSDRLPHNTVTYWLLGKLDVDATTDDQFNGTTTDK